MKRRHGTILKLFVGNMGCGKTDRLIHEVEKKRKYGKKKVIVFRPTEDKRSKPGRINSRTGHGLKAFEVPGADPRRVWKILRKKERSMHEKFDIVVLDEIQFFRKDPAFFRLVNKLLKKGYDIMAGGLVLDFRGEQFGPTLWLVLMAMDKVVRLDSCCTKCGEDAIFTQRMIKGKPAPHNSPLIMTNAKYEPRCFNCYEFPKK